MTDNLVTWEEPPTSNRGRPSKMSAIVEQLKTRPGRWARIDVSPATAYNYSQGHPEIEITIRNRGKSNKAVYAIYIGEIEEAR